MKALLISDVESPALWDYYRPERLQGAEVIISCGDLKREYLEFLVTMSGKPVFYYDRTSKGSEAYEMLAHEMLGEPLVPDIKPKRFIFSRK